MTSRRALVIAVDGLRASALGAYGNAWYETPAADALAARARVVDWMWCDGPSSADFFRAAWSGIGPDGANSSQPGTLADMLSGAVVPTLLVTDDPQVASAAKFSETCRVDISADRAATAVEETCLAQLFAVAAEQLQSSSPGLTWIHARGFHGAWDAPLALRAELLDEDDPAPSASAAPPTSVTPADHDETLVFRAAYAAQAIVLDACLGALLAALGESPLEKETLIVLVGTRGYALGEHRRVGGDCHALYSELLHIPCLVRAPLADGPQPRYSRLAQPADLFATVLDWFGVTPPVERGSARSLLNDEDAAAARQWVAASGPEGELAVRTAAWMLRRPPQLTGEPPPQVELFAKPDDRWEANEIADRCPDIAERLLAAVSASFGGTPTPLEADLTTAIR